MAVLVLAGFVFLVIGLLAAIMPGLSKQKQDSPTDSTVWTDRAAWDQHVGWVIAGTGVILLSLAYLSESADMPEGVTWSLVVLALTAASIIGWPGTQIVKSAGLEKPPAPHGTEQAVESLPVRYCDTCGCQLEVRMASPLGYDLATGLPRHRVVRACPAARLFRTGTSTRYFLWQSVFKRHRAESALITETPGEIEPPRVRDRSRDSKRDALVQVLVVLFLAAAVVLVVQAVDSATGPSMTADELLATIGR